MKDKIIIIGKFSIPYGIKGWIKIISFTEKKIFFYQPWYIKNNKKINIIDIERWEKKYNSLIVKLKNIDNRTNVNFLKNKEILIHKKTLPNVNNEYYWHDIINCIVFNQKSTRIGTVKKIIATGSNDVLIIKKYCKKKFITCKKIFIPFIMNQVVKDVDVINKTIVVNWNENYL